MPLLLLTFVFVLISFGLVKSYNMPCNVESASLEPKHGNKFTAGGEDMWVHVFDFHTGEELGRCLLRLRDEQKYRGRLFVWDFNIFAV